MNTPSVASTKDTRSNFMKNIKQLVLVLAVGCAILTGCNTVSSSTRRQAYVDSHPNLDADTKQSILEGKVMIGMTIDEARICAGLMHQIDSVTLAGTGTSETWYNGWYYLYFRNGRLVGWREKR
jgi:hypothetical protein